MTSSSSSPGPPAVPDAPHPFEPLLPSAAAAAELCERGADIAARSLRLQGSVHPASLQRLRELMRAMNAHCSHLIEGQGTPPRFILQALAGEFAPSPDIARGQRLALAHMEAEQALEQRVLKGEQALSSAFVMAAHGELYRRLGTADRPCGQGTPLEPGQLRSVDVSPLRHQPPAHWSLPRLLARFDTVFAHHPWHDHQLPMVAACAHHRMAWLHPFVDGNGLAVRLQTHAALWRLSGGLWSVNRALARQRDAYTLQLREADMARQGEPDGRGTLGEPALLRWCRFFLDLCADQVGFMARLLDLPDMRLRVARLVAARSREPGRGTVYRPEVELPLYHLFAAGPVSRGEFQQLTGLPQRTAVRVLQGLLNDGIVTSASRHAPVHLALPLDALPWLLPGLYPEAAPPAVA